MGKKTEIDEYIKRKRVFLGLSVEDPAQSDKAKTSGEETAGRNEEKKDRANLSFFGRFLDSEVEKGKDLCEWSTEELQRFFDDVATVRQGSMRCRITLLKKYTAWCVEQGYTDTDRGKDLKTPDTAKKVASTTVSGPEELQAYLDAMCGKEVELRQRGKFTEQKTDKSLANIIRCYYWMAFAGIPERIATSIRTEDVNFANMCFVYNGINEFPIYKEGLQSVINCFTLKAFEVMHSSGYLYERDRFDGGGNQLLRMLRGNATDSNLNLLIFRYRKNAREAAKETDPDHTGILWRQLTYSSVWLSGQFYRVHEIEKKLGVMPDFKDVAETVVRAWAAGAEANDKETRRLSNIKANRLKREFEKDYEVWKEVFHPEDS